MSKSERLPVTLCLQNQISTGYIDIGNFERLSDLLNGKSINKSLENQGRFLALTDVTNYYGDGKEERLASAYINKSTVCMVATWDGNSGRGVGSKKGPKTYPYINKMPIPVKLSVSSYSLNGKMHCARSERAGNLLEEDAMFLPLTDVNVHPLGDGLWSNVPFVAVNRGQILSLQEEETPLLKVGSTIAN